MNTKKEQKINLQEIKIFLDDNPKQFRELANGVYGGKGVLSIYVTIINRQKELAIKIIEDLRKEYSIK